jgi:glycerophosphoryl diester phosphodiesterase
MMATHMQTTWREIGRLTGSTVLFMRTNLWTLAVLELGVAVVTGAAIAPLAAWSVERLIQTTGHTSISNYDLIAFAVSIPGIAAIMLAGTSFVSGRFLHEGMVMSAALDPEESIGSPTLRAVLSVVRSMPRLIRLAMLEFTVVVAASTPFVAAAWLAYATLLTNHDINYYLAVRPSEFEVFRGILWLLALSLVLVEATVITLLVYASPLVLFEAMPARRAIARSFTLVRERAGRVFGAMAVHAGIWVAAASAAWMVFQLADYLVVSVSGSSLALLVLGVGALVTIKLIVAVVGTALFFCSRAFVVAALYRAESGSPTIRVSPVANPNVRGGRPVRARVAIAFAIVIVAVGAGGVSWVIIGNLRPRESVLITAHRGASRDAPENTLVAIRAAAQHGADLVEIDVQRTKDGVVVVLHDADLMRIASDPRKVWQLDYADFADIDVGSWYDARFAGERVPTLASALEEIRGRTRLLIELKYNRPDDELAMSVVNVIREAGMEADVVIMSLEAGSLIQVRELAPEIPIGLTVTQSIGDIVRLDVDFLAVSSSGFTPSLRDRAAATGKQVHVWTVNEPAEMIRFLAKGADNLITDEVSDAIEIRDHWNGLTTAEMLALWYTYR